MHGMSNSLKLGYKCMQTVTHNDIEGSFPGLGCSFMPEFLIL